MAENELGSVGAAVEISVNGVSAAMKQVDALSDKIDKISDVAVDLDVKVKEPNWDKLFKAGDKRVAELKQTLESLGDVSPDFSAIENKLSKLFKGSAITAWAGQLKSGFKLAEGSATSAAQQITSAWTTARNALVKAQTAFSQTSNPAAQAEIAKSAEAISKAFGKLSFTPGKGISETAKGISAVGKAADIASSELKEVSSDLQKVAKAGDALHKIDTLAQTATGSLKGLGTVGMQAISRSLGEVNGILRDLAGNKGFFQDLFGRGAAKQIQNVDKAIQNLKKAEDNLRKAATAENLGNGTTLLGEEVKDVSGNAEVQNALKEYNTAVNAAMAERQKLASSILKTMFSTKDTLAGQVGLQQQYLEETREITAAEIRRKEAIVSAMSGIRGGRAVLEQQRQIENQIVAIVRNHGDMESATLNAKLKSLRVDEKRLQYAARLLEASQKLAKGSASSSTLGAQYALSQEAYSSYQATARSGSGKTLEQSIAGMKQAAQEMARIGTENKLRDSLSAVIANINAGLIPSYNEATAAVLKYYQSAEATGSKSVGGIQMMNAALKELRAQYEKLEAVKSKDSLSQRTSSLRLMEAMYGTVSQQTGKDTAQTNKRFLADAQATLAVDKENYSVIQKITQERGKLLTLLSGGLNIVGNEKKLYDAVRDSIRSGVPIEEKLMALTQNKAAAARKLYDEMLNIQAVHAGLTSSHQSELTQLKAQRDLWVAIRATTISTGNVQMSDGKVISQANAEAQVTSLNKQIADKQRVIQLDAEYGRRQEVILAQLNERAAAERKITDIAVKAATAVKENSLEYNQLSAAVKAYVESVRTGQNISDTGLDMRKAEEAALQSLITSEERLKALMVNENETIHARVAAAQALEQIYARIAQFTAAGRNQQVRVTPDRSLNVSQDYVDAGQQQASEFLKNNLAQAKREASETKQALLTIPEAIQQSNAVLQNTAGIQQKRAELENKFAQEIRASREALLAGVDPMSSFLNLQNAVNKAASAGVQIDRESLAILQNKAAVMHLLVGQVATSLRAGLATEDPTTAAYIAKQNRPRIEQLRESGVDTSKLDVALNRVEEKAGAALAGSFAAAQQEVDKTTQSVSKLFSGMKYTTAEAGDLAAAYNENYAYLNRIIEGTEKLRKAESSLLNNADALNKLDSESLVAQARKVTLAEQLAAALRNVQKAQTNVDANLSKIGNFTIADAATKQGSEGIASTAKTDKNSRYFVGATEGVNTLKQSLAEALSIMSKMSPEAQKAFAPIRNGLEQVAVVADKASVSMGKLNSEQKRLASNDSGASIFDKFRVYWFMQLRAFWEMYTNIGQLITTLAQYNQTLATLQAVTQGTTRDIQQMSTQFAGLANVVPLSLGAISKAALEVAKAGFNMQDTLKIIQSASKLAVATQSDITTVADLQSVIIHAWHADVNDIDKISDQLFNAVAKSRADIEGLASAIGYVAGIAPQANVPLDQALGVISILTNAGLTMSNAGTYTRQFLNDLMNPTDKLKNIVAGLGISLQDIDPRLNSLEQIFRTLSNSGMNVADAFEGMSIRAASAFSVMLKNSNLVGKYVDDINELGATDNAFARASDTTVASFNLLVNSIVNLGQSLAELTGGTARTFLDMLSAFIQRITEVTEAINSNAWAKEFIGFLATAIPLVGGLKIGFALLSKIMKGLGGLNVFAGLIAGAKGAADATKGAAAAAEVLNGTLKGFLLAHPYLVAIAAAVSLATYAFMKLNSETYKTTESITKMKEAVEDLKASTEKGFKIRIDYEEAKNIGGTITAASRTIGQNEGLATPVSQNIVRQNMQIMAASLRGSEDTKLQALGTRMVNAIFTPGSSMEDMRKSLEEVRDIAAQAQDIIRASQKGVEDWAKSQETNVGKAVDTIGSNLNRLQGIIRKAGANKTELSSDAFGGLATADLNRATEDRQELASIRAAIIGRKEGTNPNMGDLLTGMFGGVNSRTKDFSGYIETISRRLEAMNMPLKNDEASMLRAARSADTFRAAVDKLLESRDAYLRSSARTGFDPTSYTNALDQMKAASASMGTVLSEPSYTEGALKDALTAAKDFQSMLEEAQKSGLSDDPQFKAFLDRWKNLNEQVERYRKTSEANIKLTERLLKEDPTAISPEAKKQLEKRLADNIKSQIAEAGALTGGATEATAYDMMFGGGGSADIQARNQKALDSIAQIASLIQKLGGEDPLRTMDKQAMKDFNKALKDFVAMQLKNAPGDTVWEKFLNGYNMIAARFQKEGGQAPDMRGMAQAAQLSREMLAQFETKASLDPFQTVAQYVEQLNKAGAQFAEASPLLNDKDIARFNKAYLSGQKSVMALNREMSKSISSAIRLSAAYRSASAGITDISLAVGDLRSSSLLMDENAQKAEEYAGKLEAVQVAAEDAQATIKTYNAQMSALMNQPDGTVISMQTMREAADGLKNNLQTVTQQLSTLKNQLTAAKKEMIALRLNAASDNLEFVKSYNEAKRAQSYRPDDQFRAAQENINLQKQFISQNAQFMDVDAARSALQSLRAEMVNFAKQFPHQPRAQQSLEEARGVNDMIQSLYRAEFEKRQADAQVLQVYQQSVIAVGEQINSTLTEILTVLRQNRSDNAGISMQPLPVPTKLPPNVNVGKGQGALSAKYESGGRGSQAIGYDQKGGTSYGTWQLSSRQGSLDNFFKFLEKFDPALLNDLMTQAKTNAIQKTGDANAQVNWNTGSRRTDEPGPRAWQTVALQNPERMRKAEEAFIGPQYFAPALDTFSKAAAISIEKIPLAVQQALWSTSVQHGMGGQKPLVQSAVAGARDEKGNVNYEQFLRNLYAQRARVHPDDAKTRYPSELADAINGLKAELSAPEQKPADKASADLGSASESLTTAAAALQEAVKRKEDLEAAARSEIPTAGNELRSPVVNPEAEAAAKAAGADVQNALQTYFAAIAEIIQRAQSAARAAAGQTPAQQTSMPTMTAPAPMVGTGTATAIPNVAQNIQLTTTASAQLNAAITRSQEATKNLSASILGATTAASGLDDVMRSSDLTWKSLAASYLDGYDGSAAEYSKELFTNEINAMKQGLTNVMQTSVRDAINGTSDWETAAWDMIYSMIDSWINSVMNNLMNSMIASISGQGNTWGWAGFGNEGSAAGMGGGLMGLGGAIGGMFAHTGGLVPGYNSGGTVGDMPDAIYALHRHEGGPIPGFAVGGLITQGNQQADSTLAMLTKGEFVMQEPTVRKFGVDFMRTLNEGSIGDVQRMLGDFGVMHDNKSENFTGQDAQGMSSQGAGMARGPVQPQKSSPMSIVNVSDPADVGRFLATPRGERMVLNIMNKNMAKSRGRFTSGS